MRIEAFENMTLKKISGRRGRDKLFWVVYDGGLGNNSIEMIQKIRNRDLLEKNELAIL